MFELISDDSSLELGIEVYKTRRYRFENGFLCGTATYDVTSRALLLSVEPNYDRMASIATCKESLPLSLEFDNARSHSIQIGPYQTMAVADYAVNKLDHWYQQLLKRKGANQRFLIDDGNSQYLVEDENASNIRYGDAIISARTMQAFAMMKENKSLDYHTVVAKIMPVFLQALGLKEYQLSHDLSEDGYGEVRFIIEKIGAFSFRKPLNDNEPAYLERYTYSNGDYRRSFAGPVKGDVMKTMVFDWLLGAAKELKTLSYDEQEIEQQIDTLTMDVRHGFVKKDMKAAPSIAILRPETPTNIISLGAYRAPHI